MKQISNKAITIALFLALSCTKEPLHNPQTTGTQTEINSAMQTTGHYIGQRFGGGVIFLLSKDSLHGLIADTVDLPQAQWSNGTYIVTGATATGLLGGPSNTRKIIASQGRTGNYAALECANSTISGKRDWFLPSIDELHALFLQKNVVGGFAGYLYNYYWSSSEGSQASYEATIENFDDGGSSNLFNKHDNYHVRAVRAF